MYEFETKMSKTTGSMN